MTTRGSASRRMSWRGRRRDRRVTRWRWRCARYGVPEQILTDNGKVFTGRFGPGTGEVLFDRICRENGIKHLLTAPRSPTTTGKVERWHKTLRREFLNGKVFASIEDAQAQLDGWVAHYNYDRPHQRLGMAVPWDRFQLAQPQPVELESRTRRCRPSMPTATRRVGRNGLISFAAASYRAGVWLAGQDVTVVCDGGLVQLHHRGVLIATHARRHAIDKQDAGMQRASTADAARAVGVGAVGDPQGRLVGQRVASPARTTASATSTGAARSKSRSSAIPSRSPSANSSSAPTRSATTAPANTAPSPTPAADPAASTPPKPTPSVR